MLEKNQQLRIGIAEGGVIQGEGRIFTRGLGSCVGLVLYDACTHIAGMVHIMLPYSPEKAPLAPQKYADTGISWLFETLVDLGVNLACLKAKYAGGAQMFRHLTTEALRIGERNIAAIEEMLDALEIPVISTDTGGNYGRSVWFEMPSCRLVIRTATGELRQI
ncbi:chemotaxis protein CheD [Alicyclobacillus fodiniaquatilis]|jgi:chemotaxis protein CheD|uniref:Probable chemoreceptor glutamine deamidase CheD n=1 Tax=Alicyclobacillus fodiniaquatilis TaxID=1661150 RepID=A0ABW4JE75_9BACL